MAMASSNQRRQRNRKMVGGAAGALISTGLGLLFLWAGGRLTHLSYDLPFSFRAPLKADEAVLIYLDDASHSELQQPFGRPWSRLLHARLVERLAAEGARAVVFDIAFADVSPEPGADARLAGAMRTQGKVFLPLLEVPADDPGLNGVKLEPPCRALQDAAVGLGLPTLDYDEDRVNRRHYAGTEDHASLAWAVAQTLRAGSDQPLAQRWTPRWLNYYGPPLALPHVSFARALATNELGAGFFKGKVVFIGSRPTAGFTDEKKEEYPTPYTSHTRTFAPGVEVHATAFLNLLRGDWLRRLPPVLETLLVILLGVAFGAGLTLCHPLPATGIAVAGGLVIAGLALMLFRAQIWFAWLVPVAVQIPAAALWSIVLNSVRLHIEKRVLQESLGFHLSPQRVTQILSHPELLHPGAEEQEVSILMTDIANFTRLTGRMTSHDLFRLLNEYYASALACVHETDGTVISLAGDAIFAIWNAPFPQPDHAERACRTALALQTRLVHFDAEHQSLPLRTRVGLHTGPAHVGNLGSSRRFEYTAVGDHVNLASRLEGLNKHLGTDLLATRDIQRVVEHSLLARRVGHFRFKGFDRVAEVHELIGPVDQAEATRSWREAFAEALFHFQRRAFDAAAAGFRHTLELRPGDGPSGFYLERIDDLRTTPPPQDWAGEIDLKSK